ncbi:MULTISPECIES: GNAT family N-acetyltransferase [unclassified Duganella]|uniref:GNAT family N-acetyltransferase n=1 Tax=unclassified Duganella TaxID=2636909 RepID=UPI000873A1CE|nr:MULTISPECIES: GNAT family protein [unclassified Duganella]OEZ64039.1 putative ribosomal N-acetyltransferase YdaF [Duganella sp. HH105]OFA06811.1 putative ribosomal N-acetyltransferase YdaF [Duganella sp. HH101]
MTPLPAGSFLLRPFIAADAPAFAAGVRESMDSVGMWMTWAHAEYSEEQALSWFDWCDASRADGSAYEFGIFLADGVTLVGGGGLNQLNAVNGFCNLGYWVRASAQRQGAAAAAVGALSRYAFEQLNQSRVEIVIAAGNEPSAAVARKAGATHECLARNRLKLRGICVDAHVFSMIPS